MKGTDSKYKKVPNRDNDMCFGCSPINPYGLQMKFFADGEYVFSELSAADHLSGWKNVVHGGVITTIFDEIMVRAGIYFLKKVTLTKSITVNFLQSAYVGKKLRAEGRVSEVKSEREAMMEASLVDNEGNLCATATGTFAIFDPAVALERGMIDETALQSLELMPKT